MSEPRTRATTASRGKEINRVHALLIATILAGLALVGLIVFGLGCIGLLLCDASIGHPLDGRYPYADSLTASSLGDGNAGALPPGFQ